MENTSFYSTWCHGLFFKHEIVFSNLVIRSLKGVIHAMIIRRNPVFSAKNRRYSLKL